MSGVQLDDTVLDEFDFEEPYFLELCPKCGHSFSVEGPLNCYDCPKCGHLIIKDQVDELSGSPFDDDEDDDILDS
ncbi:hypothetical protein COT97_02570 [Candidatus Falkowbacteria bacterium CG10_big_fil_rev_8_21_14_0_10_39_11]|uniref:Uncharacterized protein n=1 Tax=Candidatus Falkowbacteria bacterium CG10_big_fil_rev_8_21_14_0_10_39_11 TaxID=1974565 RepID=A0A2H0V566_9BACT|nr:MAG: hypothetical protein COT97_02570 [Candidatus Falkowbacteria bacterium CG10_big_fil_rev_8_21_14_0_10_39_11]